MEKYQRETVEQRNTTWEQESDFSVYKPVSLYIYVRECIKCICACVYTYCAHRTRIIVIGFRIFYDVDTNFLAFGGKTGV